MAVSDDFYNEVIIEVDQVIDDLGTVYTMRSVGPYDPSSISASVGTQRTVSGLVADKQIVSGLGPMAKSDVDLSWIGLKTLVLKATANPLAKEEVQVDGQWFSLSKVVPIKPAEVTVVYLLDVTR